MQITAGTITQYLDIDSGDTFTNVPWVITEPHDGSDGLPPGERTVFEGNQSFPLTATKEEVTDFLARTLQVHIDDLARHESSKEFQANLESAANLSAELSGTVIGNDSADIT